MTERPSQYITHEIDHESATSASYGEPDYFEFVGTKVDDVGGWDIDWLVALKAAGFVITWTLCLSFAIAALLMFFTGSVSMGLFLALFSLLFKPGGIR